MFTNLHKKPWGHHLVGALFPTRPLSAAVAPLLHGQLIKGQRMRCAARSGKGLDLEMAPALGAMQWLLARLVKEIIIVIDLYRGL